MNILNKLKNELIVSIQAMPNEPLYDEVCINALAKSVVELGEVYLVGEVGDTPVALLGGVPAMARVATKRNKQQISLIKSSLQVRRNLLIKRSAECKNHGVLAFQ